MVNHKSPNIKFNNDEIKQLKADLVEALAYNKKNDFINDILKRFYTIGYDEGHYQGKKEIVDDIKKAFSYSLDIKTKYFKIKKVLDTHPSFNDKKALARLSTK